MNNPVPDATSSTGTSNIESSGLDTLRDEVLMPDDLLGFQWQIACGMVLLQYFRYNILKIINLVSPSNLHVKS